MKKVALLLTTVLLGAQAHAQYNSGNRGGHPPPPAPNYPGYPSNPGNPSYSGPMADAANRITFEMTRLQEDLGRLEQNNDRASNYQSSVSPRLQEVKRLTALIEQQFNERLQRERQEEEREWERQNPWVGYAAISPRGGSFSKRSTFTLNVTDQRAMSSIALYARTASYESSKFTNVIVTFTDGTTQHRPDIGSLTGNRSENNMHLLILEVPRGKAVRSVTMTTSDKVDWAEIRGRSADYRPDRPGRR